MTTYYLIWFIGNKDRHVEEAFCRTGNTTYILTEREAAIKMLKTFDKGHWAGHYRLIEVREDEL